MERFAFVFWEGSLSDVVPWKICPWQTPAQAKLGRCPHLRSDAVLSHATGCDGTLPTVKGGQRSRHRAAVRVWRQVGLCPVALRHFFAPLGLPRLGSSEPSVRW